MRATAVRPELFTVLQGWLDDEGVAAVREALRVDDPGERRWLVRQALRARQVPWVVVRRALRARQISSNPVASR